MFFRWIVARYAAYPNVVWDFFSKEAHNEKDLDYKLGRLRFLRASDPYHHLMTNHDDDDNNDRGVFDTLNDFRTDQQHSKLRETILAQRQRRPWPVANAEFGYEQGPGGPEDKTYDSTHTPDELVRRAWEISMAGGYTAYYSPSPRGTCCGRTTPRRATLTSGTCTSSLDPRAIGRWSPAENLAREGWTLANPGREYIVFLQKAGPLTLSPAGPLPSMKAEWFNPLTAEREPAGLIKAGTTLRPPESWRGGMAVLHVWADTVRLIKYQLFWHSPEGFRLCPVAEDEGRQEPSA